MSLIVLTDLHPAGEAVCPTNGKKGKRVDTKTVQSFLDLPLNVLRAVHYRFCADPACPTVYYSEDGLQEFTEADLRERVFQKHPTNPDSFVCYCFRLTVAKVREGGKNVYAEVDRGVRNGQCACEIRNPQGSCCLGNVNNLIKVSQFGI
jgi:hypothetical protein